MGPVNYKQRVFVLTPQRLTYYEGTVEVSGSVVYTGDPSYYNGNPSVSSELTVMQADRHVTGKWDGELRLRQTGKRGELLCL